MIFQFQAGDVTFFDEDREYFEKRLNPLKKYMGSVEDKEHTDTINTEVKLSKTKHHSGDRFQAIASVVCKNFGTLRSEVDADNIKKLADLLHDNLKTQIRKLKDKATSK